MRLYQRYKFILCPIRHCLSIHDSLNVGLADVICPLLVVWHISKDIVLSSTMENPNFVPHARVMRTQADQAPFCDEKLLVYENRQMMCLGANPGYF